MSFESHSAFADVQDKPLEWLTVEAATILRQYNFVCSEINARAPVSRLPADVLLELFKWVQKLESVSSTKWTRVSLVCRTWRETAIHNGALWPCIVPVSRAFVDTCLERAGGAPLSLSWGADRLSKPLDLSTLKTVSERLIRIDIVLDSTHLDTFAQLTSWPLPNLQTLALSYCPRFNRSTKWIYMDILSENNVPLNLHTLHLDRIMPRYWNNLTLYTNLRTLHIEGSASGEFFRVRTVKQFPTILQSCPLLENLHFHLHPFNTSAAARQITIDVPRVELGRLKRLRCSSEYVEELQSLLGLLSLQATTDVQIEAFGAPTIPDSTAVGPLFCLPDDSTHLGFLGSIGGMNLMCGYFPGSDPTTTTIEFSGSILQPPFAIPVRLKSRHTIPTPDAEQRLARHALLDLRVHFARSPLSTLGLTFKLPALRLVTVEDWQNVFAAFPLLDNFCFGDVGSGGEDTDDDVECLRRIIQSLTVQPFLVPRLCTFQFFSIKPLTRDKIAGDLERGISARKALLLGQGIPPNISGSIHTSS